MSSSFFITATGTEIGKTLVTTSLCHQIIEAGYTVKAIKPIITGYIEGEENDITELVEAQKLPISQESIDKISFLKLKEPISPDIAAKLEEKDIKINELLYFCEKSAKNEVNFHLIEGIGGAMVPLNNTHTVLDLITELDVPVILVTGTYLGSLSHTLTTIEAIKSRGVNIKHLVISESEEPQTSLENFLVSLKAHIDIPITVIPTIESSQKKWQNAPSLLHIIQGDEVEERKAG